MSLPYYMVTTSIVRFVLQNAIATITIVLLEQLYIYGYDNHYFMEEILYTVLTTIAFLSVHK